MPENPLPIPPPPGSAPKGAVKLAPLSGTPVKSETLKITLPPRSDSGMKAPAPLMAKPSLPTAPLPSPSVAPAVPTPVAPPLPPKIPAPGNLADQPTIPIPRPPPLAPAAPKPSAAAADEFERTIKIGAPGSPQVAPSPLAPPKLQTKSIPVIAPKPLASAPVPKAITEAIPMGAMPPRPNPKSVAPASIAAPKINNANSDTKSINLATGGLPNPGISAQGPASIPPKVAVPGTAPRSGAAPLPPKPVALGGKPALTSSGVAAPLPSGPASVSAKPAPTGAKPPASTPSVAAPVKVAVAQEVDESEELSMLLTVLAVVAAILALGVSGYLYWAMSNNVVG